MHCVVDVEAVDEYNAESEEQLHEGGEGAAHRWLSDFNDEVRGDEGERAARKA